MIWIDLCFKICDSGSSTAETTVFLPIKSAQESITLDPNNSGDIQLANKLLRLHIVPRRIDYSSVSTVLPSVLVLQTFAPSTAKASSLSASSASSASNYSRVLVSRSGAPPIIPESNTVHLTTVDLHVSAIGLGTASDPAAVAQVLEYIPCSNGVIYLVSSNLFGQFKSIRL